MRFYRFIQKFHGIEQKWTTNFDSYWHISISNVEWFQFGSADDRDYPCRAPTGDPLPRTNTLAYFTTALWALTQSLMLSLNKPRCLLPVRQELAVVELLLWATLFGKLLQKNKHSSLFLNSIMGIDSVLNTVFQ